MFCDTVYRVPKKYSRFDTCVCIETQFSIRHTVYGTYVQLMFLIVLSSKFGINLSVLGIVLLDGITDDEMEAKALMNAISLVDIYSGSWGPKDNGLMVDGPGVLAQMAFDIGANKVITIV